MSVTSCELSWHGANGSRSGTPESYSSEYSAGWKIKTSSALDGPQVVLEYCRQNADGRPHLGMQYRFGNDTDVACYCSKLSPARDSQVATLWEVTAEFTSSTKSGQGTEDIGGDGKPTTDPTKWAPKCNVRTMSLAAYVDKAKFLGLSKPGAGLGFFIDHWPIGKIGPVVNSARIAYDPPLEYDRSISVINFTFFSTKYLGGYWGGLRDALNTDTMVFAGNFFNYSDQWLPFTARIKNVDGTFNFQNDTKYWEMNMEVLHDPLGWDRHILDQGEIAQGRLGDPADERMISIGDLLAIPEVTVARHVVGLDGIPVAGPVPFDGDGRPLVDPTPDNRVYLDYRVYLNERAFAPVFALFLNAGAQNL